MLYKFGNFWQGLVEKEKIIKPVTDITETIFNLAQTLRKGKLDEHIEKIIPLCGLSTFISILNSPLAKVVGSNLPFIRIAISLLKYYQERTQKQLTLEECAAVVSQAAYLKSLRNILDKGIDEELKTKIENNQTPASSLVEKEIDNLKDLELDEQELLKTIDGFPDSKLAKAFRNILKARLKESGLNDDEADILCERIAWNTPRYVMEAWSDSSDAIKHFAKPSVLEWVSEQKKYQSIDDYLEKEIAKKPEDQVFLDTVFLVVITLVMLADTYLYVTH